MVRFFPLDYPLVFPSCSALKDSGVDLGSDQMALRCLHHGRNLIGDAELLDRIAHVEIHRTRAEIEDGSDIHCGLA